MQKSPYQDIADKYKVKVDFRQFIEVHGIPSREFRKQRINLGDYSAVIFTSRNAIDHYFRLCEELRVRMSEMTKYFCLTEAIAVYLQKYIQYRKRKVFYGAGKESDLFELFSKQPHEKYLLPCTPVRKDVISEFMQAKKYDYTEAVIYEAVPADLSDMHGKIPYDMLILFTPAGVQSLFQNFPGFSQDSLVIGVMGTATCKAMEEAGLRVDLKAPTAEFPSIIMALENYLATANRKK